MPLPVSIALAGHTIIFFCRNVTTSSIRAHVRIAVAIWGIESRKWNSVSPSTYSVKIVADTCSRGSFGDGRITGYDRPAIRSEREGAPATVAS
jgi:hypothetical protein